MGYDVPTTRKHTAQHIITHSVTGWAALHLAAQEGKVDVVRLILTEAQALINIQTKVHSHHITTLSTALSFSHVTRAEKTSFALLVLQY